jgi:hypothetical protein
MSGRRLLVPLAVVLALTAGCGVSRRTDQGAGSDGVAITVETTTVPATTDTSATTEGSTDDPTSKDEWADRYRKALAPANCAGNAIADAWSAYEANPTWERAQALQPRLEVQAITTKATVKRLEAETWPADLQADITDVEDYFRKLAPAIQKLSEASTYEEFQALEYPAPPEALAKVRAALGMPKVDDDPTDWCAID